MANHRKYGIPSGKAGVYKITNKFNGKSYIGASKNISSRISTHMGRDAKRYMHHPFYEDIRIYGVDGFIYEILEECNGNLLEREQFYYDLLKPQYNVIRPIENSFKNPEHREKACKNSNTPEQVAKRKYLYSSTEYRAKFMEIQKHRMKRVEMYKDGILIDTFNSLSECQRWLNDNTEYKGKNKVSKIKSVCEGERPTAFGYTFKYVEV